MLLLLLFLLLFMRLCLYLPLLLPIFLTLAAPILALWGKSLLVVSHGSSLVVRMSHVLVCLVGGQPVLVVPPSV